MVTLGRGGEAECDTGEGEDYTNDKHVDRHPTMGTPRNMPAHTLNPIPRDSSSSHGTS
jgi:hypothetical protein